MTAVNAVRGYICMALLALQFGMQPIVTQTFRSATMSRTLIVMLGELLKAVIALFLMGMNQGGIAQLSRNFRNWNLRKSIAAVGLPALTFPVQNLLVVFGVDNTPPTLFVILNQTKLISAAIFVYFLLGRKQSGWQCVALGMIFAAGAVVATSRSPVTEKDIVNELANAKFVSGVMAIISAALLSGLGGALCQRATILRKDDPTSIYRGNPSWFSFELSVYSVINLLVTAVIGSLTGWGHSKGDDDSAAWHIDLPSLIPIVTNACGGLLVSQVTYHAGPVKKGFAIVFGILVTSTAQSLMGTSELPGGFWISLPLVVAALILYSSTPLKKPAKSIANDKTK